MTRAGTRASSDMREELMDVRIRYGDVVHESVTAEHVGEEGKGVELLRTYRPGDSPLGPARVETIRVRREGDGYVFLGVARLGWQVSKLTVPKDILTSPACDVFRERLKSSGAVIESERWGAAAIDLLVAHPADAPLGAWHAELLAEALHVDEAGMRARVAREEAKQARTRKRIEAMRKATQRSGAGIALVAGVVALAVVGAAVVVPALWVLRTMTHAGAVDRPRLAALGMAIALAPALVAGGRAMWPFFLGAAGVAGLLAWHLGGPHPSYGMVVGTAVLYAVVLGFTGVFLGIFSGFASSSRQMGRAVFGVALPSLLSAIAAAVLAITSAAAAARSAAAATTTAAEHAPSAVGAAARVIAIGLTVLLFLAPASALMANGGAILFGKGWRRRPLLQLGALATMPLSLLPVLPRLLAPLALIWGVVWLLGGLG